VLEDGGGVVADAGGAGEGEVAVLHVYIDAGALAAAVHAVFAVGGDIGADAGARDRGVGVSAGGGAFDAEPDTPAGGGVRAPAQVDRAADGDGGFGAPLVLARGGDLEFGGDGRADLEIRTLDGDL